MRHRIISHYFPEPWLEPARKSYVETYRYKNRGIKREASPLLSAEVVEPNLDSNAGYLKHLVSIMENVIFHELMQFNRLNDSSKAIINDAIDKDVTQTEEVYALQWSDNTDKPTQFQQYAKLKNYAERLAEKYENLSRQLVREHQDSGWNGWKPFFKNLLSLFGLGISAFSRLFFGEYLYGDKLTLPQSALEGLKTEVPFDDPDIIEFSDDDDSAQSELPSLSPVLTELLANVPDPENPRAITPPASGNNQTPASSDNMSMDEPSTDPSSSHSPLNFS